ncbi:hypothetical protein HX109_01270 [Galbibacter sp. BG1]|uniref:DUF6265 family protein n=1 Tax=Galbibacter sp. BG1 TaxID=1170699 RepID=UPI0015BCCFA2|nr:DUF6265 family protein [Galbibacter sp. BG1]QLE00260.1 hypothetical protein HX109_01270 [Galbibacter sp. BG1]
MKTTCLLLALLLLFACQPDKKQNKKEEAIPVITDSEVVSFNWLLGKWKRLNEEEGKETFEVWEKLNPSKYVGLGFTMQSGDTIWQEQIKLEKDEKNWNFKVKSPDEASFTIFKVTAIRENSFECENKDIEFPNSIKYDLEASHLKATVSGGEMQINFDFEKLK